MPSEWRSSSSLALHTPYGVEIALVDVFRFAGFLVKNGEAVDGSVRRCVYWEPLVSDLKGG